MCAAGFGCWIDSVRLGVGLGRVLGGFQMSTVLNRRELKLHVNDSEFIG